jgi:hypothetical protein
MRQGYLPVTKASQGENQNIQDPEQIVVTPNSDLEPRGRGSSLPGPGRAAYLSYTAVRPPESPAKIAATSSASA